MITTEGGTFKLGQVSMAILARAVGILKISEAGMVAKFNFCQIKNV